MIYQGVDYSDRLEVSNCGSIRNSNTGHVYKLHLNKSTGYFAVVISLGSRDNKKLFKSHKAVAETFIPNPLNLPIVNHKDGVKTNCFVDNLEWCTYSYNTKHSIENKLYVAKKGIFSPLSKLPYEIKMFIRYHYIPRDHIFGARALGRELNVCHSTIIRALYD